MVDLSTMRSRIASRVYERQVMPSASSLMRQASSTSSTRSTGSAHSASSRMHQVQRCAPASRRACTIGRLHVTHGARRIRCAELDARTSKCTFLLVYNCTFYSCTVLSTRACRNVLSARACRNVLSTRVCRNVLSARVCRNVLSARVCRPAPRACKHERQMTLRVESTTVHSKGA